jgi:pentatricopeptide repeat protein
MQRADIEPDVFSHASRLRAFAKAGRGEEAQYFFKTMIASGVKYVTNNLLCLLLLVQHLVCTKVMSTTMKTKNGFLWLREAYCS